METIGSKELSRKEQAMGELAGWWGDRIIGSGEELKKQSFIKDLSLNNNRYYPFYSLVTHNCRNKKTKLKIMELGGVIGIPGYQSLLYGRLASKQILYSLGMGKKGLIGNPRDGLTFVYLHPTPVEYSSLIGSYISSLSPFTQAFGPPEARNTKKIEAEIQIILRSPWERLPINLTEGNGPKILKDALETYAAYKELIREYGDEFPYKLRMLDNKYLLGII